MDQSVKDTIAVRKGEELDQTALFTYLQQHFKDFPEEELQIKQFGAGHSNLTYSLRAGDWEAVLRKPPLGPVAPKAHDMEREFSILNALNPVFPVAPKPFLFERDSRVVGSPFFLMERRKGIVLDTEFPNGIEPARELCQSISQTMVNTLVDLHNIPYEKTKLKELSKPDGFLERQVHGWINRYERSKTEEMNGVEKLTGWLAEHMPVSKGPTVIHYDYKLNNAMFSYDLTSMTGLFDWEMTTVGDPLCDLGAAMSYWIQADDPDELKNGFGKPPVTSSAGFYTRREFIEAYAKRSGRDVANIHYYITFALFKLAVICQQIYYRYRKGQTEDQRFKYLNHTVRNLIEYANHQSSQKN
ncbi:phosphotransferase family protein [Heyndrickxia acidicola]|uniref:Phosphotransferase family protein n=1 Tax=Heyndrickxia acidicola TaxID=209389 RepID=A0ABU6MHA3_9BACI|nr:phosphotransferase family protein [Heyndrickxia acidicola]MED1204057.1 phosphotransferase family protein [Heyndrickxia acidicola]